VWAPDGKPLPGAIVHALGHQTAEDMTVRRHRFYLPPGMDKATVTDAAGEFVLSGGTPVATLDVEIRAPGTVLQRLNFLATGKEQVQLPLAEGAKVTGRVMHEGAGVAGVGLRLISNPNLHEVQDQGPSGPLVALTDAEGRFEFSHVMPEKRWILMTQMES